MAAPSLTYTLTNGSTADASQVMQNYNDLLNGITDGTKDLSINALTAAGTATLNGDVNIGNATADTLTITALLASHLIPKTAATYDLGSSALGYRNLYFGNSGNANTLGIVSAASPGGSRSYTLPDVANTAKMRVSAGQKSVTSADYAILDNDGYDTILVSCAASTRTMTLPAPANNNGRVINFKKTDNGVGIVSVVPHASETIDGAASNSLNYQYSNISLVCDGTNWFILENSQILSSSTFAPSFTTNNIAVVTSVNITALSATSFTFIRYANIVLVSGAVNCNASGAGVADFDVTLPIASVLAGIGDCAGTAVGNSADGTTVRSPAGYVKANTATAAARVVTTIGNSGNEVVRFIFSYVIK